MDKHGYHRLTVRTKDEELLEQLEKVAGEQERSKNKQILYYVRQGLQREHKFGDDE